MANKCNIINENLINIYEQSLERIVSRIKDEDKNNLFDYVLSRLNNLKYNKIELINLSLVAQKLKKENKDNSLYSEVANAISEISQNYYKYMSKGSNIFNEFRPVDLRQTANFIDIFGESLNLQAYQYIQNLLNSKSFYDRVNNKIIFNNESLNDSLFELKNELINKLKLSTSTSKIYDIKSNYLNYGEFSEIMRAFESSKLNIDIKYNEDLNRSKLNLQPIIAYYVLNNFDTIINYFLGDKISINKELFNKIDYDKNKYSFKEQANQAQDWSGDLKSMDSDKVSNNFLKWFLYQIPNGRGGYVNKEDIFEIIKTIKLEHGTTKSNEVNKDNLISLLSKPSKSVNNNLFVAVANAINIYNEEYKRQLNKLTNSDEKSFFEQHFDIVSAFIEELKNSNLSSTTSIDENGLKYSQVTPSVKSKVSIKQRIKQALFDAYQLDVNIFNPHRVVSSNNKTLGETMDIADNNFVNYVSDYYGIELSPNTLSLFNDNIEGQHLISMIMFLQKEMFQMNVLNDNELKEKIEDLIELKLSYQPSFINITNLLIKDNPNTKIKLLDQKKDQLPNLLQNSIGTNFRYQLQLFNEQFEGYNKNHIYNKIPSLKSSDTEGLYKNQNYIHDISYRNDVKFGNRIVKASELTAEETVHVMFNYEYIQNYLKFGLISNQIASYSDKSRLGLSNINAIGLMTKSYDDIKELYRNQIFSYFSKMKNSLFSFYKTIQPNQDFNSIEDIVNFLDSLNKNGFVDDFLKEYENQSFENFHFVKINGKLSLNPTLMGFIKLSEDNNYFESFLEGQLKDTLESFKSIKLDVNVKKEIKNILDSVEKEKISNIINTEKGRAIEKIFELFNMKLPSEQKKYENDIKSIKSQLNNNKGQIPEIIVKKYFIIQALLTEADIEIFGKHPYLHDSKTLKEFTMDYYNNDKNGSLINDNITQQLITGSKRNNLYGASFTPFAQNLKYGVPDEMKIAIVKDETSNLGNYNGDTNNGQEVHDGAGWTNGIFSIFEERSFLGKKFSGSKKEIGFSFKAEGVTQTKYADYVIDNELMRNSSGSELNMDILFKKMNNIEIDLSQLNDYNFKKDIYKKVGKDIFKLVDFKINEKEQLYFNWQNINSPKDIRETTIDKIDYSKYTIYDLWNLFGGKWSMEMINNEISYSNASLEVVANYISESQFDLKSKIIAKCVPHSSTKSFAQNTNKSIRDIVSDEKYEFTHYSAKTQNWGIQNDSSHEADESDIPGLTQVFSALAFNGNNIQKVNAIYEIIMDITENSLKSLNVAFSKEDDSFKKKILKDLLRSLSSAKDVSSAVQIVEKELQRLKDTNKLSAPFSSPQIFNKIASNLISDLNNKAIRQRFAGVAIVLNPSENIVKIYEDINGKIYTYTDLLNLYVPKEGVILSNDEMIQSVLNENELFLAKNIENKHLVDIGDTIKYKTKIDGEYITKVIENPSDLHNLFSTIAYDLKILKNVSRNLKTTRIKYIRLTDGNLSYDKDDIEKNLFNFWNHEAVKFMKEIKDNPEKYKDKNEEKKEKELYYKAVLQGLHNGYDYITLDDFREGVKTKITNFIQQNGEQILPKVNKTKHQIGNKSLRQLIDEGPKQFKLKLLNKYKKSKFLSNLDSKNIEYLSILKDDNEITFISNTTTYRQTPKNIQIVEKDGIDWYKDVDNGTFIIPADEKVTIIKTEHSNKVSYKIYGFNFNKESNKTIIKLLKQIKDIDYVYNSFAEDYKEFKDLQHKLNFKFDLSQYGLKLNADKDKLDKGLQFISKGIYNSILLSNQTISARIPSQSFQSFMSMETVAFIEKNTNDGYVNIWEIWFQGSDFDIDKAYTAMYDINNLGIISTPSPFVNFSSPESILESLSLPIPKKSLIIKRDKNLNENDKIDFIEIYNNIIKSIPDEKRNNNIFIANKILLEMNKDKYKDKSFFINTELKDGKIKNIVRLLNLHNRSHNINGYKNMIVKSTYEISSDIRNLEHSNQPMSSSKFRTIADDIEPVDKQALSYLNPFTKAKTQENASLGNSNVGVTANGVKVEASLQQYFNNYYLTHDKIDDIKRINLELNFTFKLKGEIKTIEKKIVRLANTKITEKIAEVMYEVSDNDKIKEILDAIALEENVADSQSMLISLSTDNAKELLLNRIRATPQLTNLHLAMLSLGFTIEETLQISMNCFDVILEKMKQNRFYVKENSLDLIKIINSLDVKKYPFKQSLLQIAYYGQEMTQLARFYKINTGLSASYYEAQDFLKKLINSHKQILAKPHKEGKVSKYKPLNISKFLNDKDYREEIILQVNNHKTVINVFDVIANSKTYLSMLKAFYDTVSKYETISSKAKFLSYNTKSNQQSTENDITIGEEEQNINHLENEVYIDQKIQSQIFDHYIIGEALKKLTRYTFFKRDLFKKFNMQEFKDTQLGESFDLSYNEGIIQFIKVMNNNIIPNLKEKYKNNSFFINFDKKYNKQYGMSFYDLTFETFGDLNIQDEYIIEKAENDFLQMSTQNSGIKNAYGESIKNGELFYLYYMITQKNRLGSFAKILKTIESRLDVNLPEVFNEEYKNADNNIDAIEENVFPFLHAMSIARTKGINIVDRYNFSFSNKLVYTLDQNNKSMNIDELKKLIANIYGINITIECTNGM